MSLFRKPDRILPAFVPPLLAAALLAAGLPTVGAAAPCERADVVVYGATPAGVAAAVQAGRMGRSVVLLEPSAHVGGMMASGLTRTDASPRRGVYGGIVAAFLERAWDTYRFKDPIRVYFESGWAERTLSGMAGDAGARIVLRQRVVGVVRAADRRFLAELDTASGGRFCGGVFVDASYEGDLMAAAGVRSALGRESAATYGEPDAGVQAPHRPTAGTAELRIDPYVTPGDPASGLIWGVTADPGLAVGAGDDAVMAYNYRLCITDVPGNRVPFTRPADYDPARYVGLARSIAALRAAGKSLAPNAFIGIDPMPNGKRDVNSSRLFGTDVWHRGAAYIRADAAGRERIRAEIASYIKGYMWFGANDPQVPAKTRAVTAAFGWCADEFEDNGNFPRQLYVREGRRLLGKRVVTERDLLDKTDFPDSIGLGYGPIDQHGLRRTVEGGLIADDIPLKSRGVGPYEIPYRALLPWRVQAANLIVPVAMAASHVAYSSIRMEPTLMVLGQAAGAAAAMAPGGDLSKVDYHALRRRLVADGQVVDWP